uniref:Reverse transcriptase n=1 Tax=Gongylonema pulchrum TaxID=637853 RepID=A0A183DF92_9BILA
LMLPSKPNSGTKQRKLLMDSRTAAWQSSIMEKLLTITQLSAI